MVVRKNTRDHVVNIVAYDIFLLFSGKCVFDLLSKRYIFDYHSNFSPLGCPDRAIDKHLDNKENSEW